MFNNFTLKVAKFNNQSGIGATVCNILHLDGRCIQPKGQDCRCSQDSYSMSVIVSRKDNGTWIWSVSDQKAVTKTITFNIKYNASITDLLLLNSSQLPADLIDVGTPAEIVCFWKNGNPPVKARLLDTQGTELNGTYSTGQIRYNFPAVSCQDAGLICCEAPGASHNQTAVLLVKSPPKMKIKTPEIEFVPGADVKIEIDVCTHTKDLLNCQLTMLPDSEKTRTCVFGNDSSLTGTPPDLSLTITLDNVMKEEKGLWRLELTNDAGTDHADFHLATGADAVPQTTAVVVAITSGMAAFAAVVVAIAVAVVVARRLSNRKADPRISLSNRVEFHSSQHQVNRDIMEDLNHSASMSEVSSAALIGEYAEPENAPAYAVSKPLDSIGTPPSYSEVADKLTISKQLRPGPKKQWKRSNTFQWHVF